MAFVKSMTTISNRMVTAIPETAKEMVMAIPMKWYLMMKVMRRGGGVVLSIPLRQPMQWPTKVYQEWAVIVISVKVQRHHDEVCVRLRQTNATLQLSRRWSSRCPGLCLGLRREPSCAWSQPERTKHAGHCTLYKQHVIFPRMKSFLITGSENFVATSSMARQISSTSTRPAWRHRLWFLFKDTMRVIWRQWWWMIEKAKAIYVTPTAGFLTSIHTVLQ